jgi:Rrf2 family iron-sulfur cluster assembly transcriptional regulator
MFSKTCEYAIRAVIYISATSSPLQKARISDIAKSIDAPSHFTAKVLQNLVHHGIISSQKGVKGGFYIESYQKQKYLIDIVRSIDGDKIFSDCGLGLKFCSEKEPCPLHHKFKTIRNELKKMIEETTVEELARSLKNGKSSLRMIL